MYTIYEYTRTEEFTAVETFPETSLQRPQSIHNSPITIHKKSPENFGACGADGN